MPNHEPPLSSYPRRWARLTVLLSLDEAWPYYEPMGFKLAEPQPFRAMLRAFVQREMLPHAAAATPAGFQTAILDEIDRRCGRNDRDRFWQWGAYTYQDVPAEHPHSFAWSMILRRAAGAPDLWSDLQLPASKSRPLLRAFQFAVDEADLCELSDEGWTPQTDWDREISNGLMFDSELPPAIWILGTIRLHRFQQGLQQLLAGLTADETEVFWSNAKKLSAAEELTSLKDLKHPGHLQEAA